MPNKFKKAILLIGDIAMMYLSLFLVVILRYAEKPTQEIWSVHFWPFTTIFLFWILIFYISDLYNLRRAASDAGFLARLGQAFGIGALLAVLFFYLTPTGGVAPKTNLVIFIVIFALIFLVWRRLFNLILKNYLPKNHLAIIGQNPLLGEIIADLKERPQLGYHIAFIFDEKAAGQKELSGIPVFSDHKELPRLIEEKKIGTVILAQTPDSNELRALLFECLPLKITFTNLAKFYENIAGKVSLDVINKMWFLENLSEGDKSAFDLIKRAADLALAIVILLATLPFWLIIALIIKIESRGPIFFSQVRAGERGRDFRMLKFRTMKTENNNFAPTAEGDKRITPFGSFLRRSRLDEIPQVINIIKGEMSFVGPRPERPELIAELEKQIPFYRERMLVKPGVTGADQISGEYHSPSFEDTMKKLQYDLYYIKNRSLYLDLSIILKTVSTVLSRAGR